MWFTKLSINNPIFATMMMITILVLGIFSYNKIPVQQFPDINFPTIVITTDYPNASAKAVEQDVTNKIEDSVNTIGGIDNLRSKSMQGKSVVIIQFNLGTKVTEDEEQVRERVSAILGQFNTNIKTPEIRHLDPDQQPVLSISLTSAKRSLRYLSDLAQNLVVKRIENVNGVGEADINGNIERQVNIDIDPNKLKEYNLSVSDIINAITWQNQNYPSGIIKTKLSNTNIEIQGEFKQISGFNNIIVAKRGDQSITLNQVAKVVDGKAEQMSAALIDGKSAVTIDILKSDDANTIAVSNNVKAKLKRLQRELPKDVKIKIIRDNAKGIINSVNNVKETILEGGLLTILVIFLFLSSWRSTVITSLTLPISVIGSFVAIYVLGFSINVMTLMALSLVIGILIDDAIVVRENISRHILLGKSHFQAALDGTKEIGLAVLATTSTLVAVFLPISFMQGMIGKMFFEFGMTVSVAVLISLFVSYTLDPMLSSIWYDPQLDINKQSGRLAAFSRWRDNIVENVSQFYQRCLVWCLEHRRKTLMITLALFCSSFLLIHYIGSEFLPSADLGEVSLAITTANGSSLKYTESKIKQIEKLIKQNPDVSFTYASIAGNRKSGFNNANIYVELKPLSQRKHTAQELVSIFRQQLQPLAGLKTMVGLSDSFGRAERAIKVSVEGPDLDTLDKIAAKVVKLMHHTKGFVDIDNSSSDLQSTYNIKIKPEIASDLGINANTIYNTISPLFSGQQVSTWLGPDDNNYDVYVQLSDKHKTTLSDLQNTPIASNSLSNNQTPVMVPLSQVANIIKTEDPSEIDHRSLEREILVSANVNGVAQGNASLALYHKINQIHLPSGYSIHKSGNTKKMIQSAGYAASSLILAVIFIYIILASQFASFTQPIAIMASLPLSLIGVFIALFITGSTFNLFSVIGCIMLMGLVTKNAILLIDFINQARAKGVSRYQAILDAGLIRLRPILMTTFAMIFGMLPLALGIGEGAKQRMSMAQAIIGGIITSTILTLIIVPVIYTYIDDFSSKVKKKFIHNYNQTRE